MSVKFGGIVYYYGFGLEEDLFFEYEQKIKVVVRELGFKVEFLDERRVCFYVLRQFNIVIDFRVWK